MSLDLPHGTLQGCAEASWGLRGPRAYDRFDKVEGHCFILHFQAGPGILVKEGIKGESLGALWH